MVQIENLVLMFDTKDFMQKFRDELRQVFIAGWEAGAPIAGDKNAAWLKFEAAMFPPEPVKVEACACEDAEAHGKAFPLEALYDQAEFPVCRCGSGIAQPYCCGGVASA